MTNYQVEHMDLDKENLPSKAVSASFRLLPFVQPSPFIPASSPWELLLESEVQFDTSDCLHAHSITTEQRSNMVDWMVEVLRLFSLSHETFFLSVRLMDVYFKCQRRSLSVNDLHITGIVCMFIASKVCDTKPLRMYSVHTKIAHQRIPKESIKAVEREVLQTIRYATRVPTLIDFLEVMGADWPLSLLHRAFLVAELVQLDYVLSGLRPSLVATAISCFIQELTEPGLSDLINLVSQTVHTLVESKHQASLKKYRISL